MTATLDVSIIRVGNKSGNASVTIDIPSSLKVLEDPKEQPPKGYGVIRVMTPQDGDKRIVWDSNAFDQIVDAKDTFDKLVAEGLVPYKVGVDGKATSEVMDEFDPLSEEIIFVPISMLTGG